MLHNRFTIGFCCMAMHKEPIKTFLDYFVNRIEKRDDCLLLIYHCFDDISSVISDSSNAASIFDAISYESIDVMVVYQSDEHQNDIFRDICRNCNERGIPVVSIDVPFDNAFFVSFGYGEAFSRIVEHVITEHNCRKIKHIAGIKGNDFTQTRIDACAQVMKKYGLEFSENDVMYGEFWDYPTRVAMDNFFASGEEMPDAFICANDSMAMSVCSKLSEKGYSVPEDVIVTGFDGIELEKYHIPRLATAKRDYDELADTIIEIIGKIRNDPDSEPYNTELSYTPVFSDSCGCGNNSLKESGALFTEFIKNYDYVLGHEERMNCMSNEIAFNPTLDNARKILREYSFSGTYLCVSDEFSCFEENVASSSISELNKGYPEKLTVLLACIDDDRYHIEGKSFSPAEILPEFKHIIPGNNTLVISSLYNPHFVIGYFTSYYVLPSDIYFKQLYTYNMMVNRCLETVRLHEHMTALNHKMEFMFTHDQLTKIYNRYGFYKNFSNAFTSHNDISKDIFIASVDLNDMKFINDNFGHSEGDEALRMTANALIQAAEAVDERIICSRFGGDEFVVAMIGNGDSEEKSELFRESFVFALNILNDSSGKQYRVSASVGLSCSPLDDIQSIEELIERADRMMYTDKARHKRRPKGM